MDSRLAQLKGPQKVAPASGPAEDREEYSQLILRPGSRSKKGDEVKKLVQGRQYVPLEEMNDGTQPGTFSVAVVVDRGGVQQTKNGKKYVCLKLTNLEKYDRERVRKSFGAMSSESAKMQINKLYNNNMYRVVSIMCFGDSAGPVHKSSVPGTVVALIGPKFFASKPGAETQKHTTFLVDNVSQLVPIGYSFDYNICCGQDSNPRNPHAKTPCYNFVNSSVEKMCDRH
jgi:hypothetical protein